MSRRYKLEIQSYEYLGVKNKRGGSKWLEMVTRYLRLLKIKWSIDLIFKKLRKTVILWHDVFYPELEIQSINITGFHKLINMHHYKMIKIKINVKNFPKVYFNVLFIEPDLLLSNQLSKIF